MTVGEICEWRLRARPSRARSLAPRVNAVFSIRSLRRKGKRLAARLKKKGKRAGIISVSYNITVSLVSLAPPSLISSRDRGNEAPRAQWQRRGEMRRRREDRVVST